MFPVPKRNVHAGREDPRGCPLQGCRAATGRLATKEILLKRILLAALAVLALGAFAAPASAAGQVCLTTDVNVNGTAAPTNGTNCVDLP
jgi:hypothetical protein